MTHDLTPPEVTGLDAPRLEARRAHLEREIARDERRTQRLRRSARVIAAALAATACAAVLLSGRGPEPDAVARALAAVDRGPYLGFSLHTQRRTTTASLIHLRAHSIERVHREIEVWFDTRKTGRGASAGGCIRLVGAKTRTGCVGAVSAGVPAAFTGAFDGYRSALANGSVRKVSSATVRGKQAWWLRVNGVIPFYARAYTIFVAVDQDSGNPLRLEVRKAGRVVGREDIDIVAEAKVLPTYVKNAWPTAANTKASPGGNKLRRSASVSLADAARLVPGALWPGRTAAGQPFRRARILTFKDGSKQLELLYGGACPRACILIKQGLHAGWAPHNRAYTELPDQTIVVTGGRYGDGRAGHIKIRLEGTSRAAVIASARALRPL
jgi:hypothetical protein